MKIVKNSFDINFLFALHLPEYIGISRNTWEYLGIPENTWEYLEYLEYLEYRNTCGISGRVRGIPRVDDPSV